MTILPTLSVKSYLQKAGFKEPALSSGITIVGRESSNNTLAKNLNDPNHGSYGLWQINGSHIIDFGGSDISLQQAYDPQISSNYAYYLSNGGSDWSPWWISSNGNTLPKSPPPPGGVIIWKGQPPGTPSPLPIAPTFANPSSINLTGSSTSNSGTYTESGSGFTYILAYTVAIAIMVMISKTRIGYIAIYYSLSLALMFLVVTQSQFIANALAPLEVAGTSSSDINLGGQTPVTV